MAPNVKQTANATPLYSLASIHDIFVTKATPIHILMRSTMKRN